MMDLVGNVWEWQGDFYDNHQGLPALRGGSWDLVLDDARVSSRDNVLPNLRYDFLGFRVAALPS